VRILGIAAAAFYIGGCSLLFDATPGSGAIDAGPDGDAIDYADAARVERVQVWSGSTALHTCASKGAEVVCWGYNELGQLGRGDREPYPQALGLTPFQLPPNGDPSKVVEMTLTYGHTCALLENGDVYCWGLNQEGQLGLNDTAEHRAPENQPVRVISPSVPVTHISAGDDYTCATTDDGKMRCWGNVIRLIESYSTLMDVDQFWGDNEFPDAKPDIPASFDVIDVSVGPTHGCAVSRFRNVMECWGSTDGGANQLYTDLNYQAGVEDLVSGGGFSCLLDNNGKINCWGNNDSGQVGTTVPYLEPDPATPLEFETADVMAKQITVGGHHSCALFVGGEVRCWGRGSNGAIGHAHSNDVGGMINLTLEKTLVDFPEAAVSIASGNLHTCVAFESDAIRCFGSNDDNQLGSGTSCADLGGEGNLCNYGDGEGEDAADSTALFFFLSP
jgi:alpha-tubulin suppressor-like RCC1 family protein